MFKLFLQGLSVGHFQRVLGLGTGVLGFRLGEFDLPFKMLRVDGVCAQQTPVGIGYALTLGQFVVVGKDSTAVAVAAQRFAQKNW